MPHKLYKILLALGIIAALIAIPAFWLAFQAGDNLEVAFLDVGQGDSILIKTPYGQNILIDGGPDNSVVGRLGEELPWWDKKIDLMISTHPHSDHLAGLIDVIKRYKVKKILYTGAAHTSSNYFTWLELIKTKKIPLIIIDRPQTIKLGQDSELNIIYPRQSFAGQTINNLNNSSIVIKLIYGETSFLFTGDMEDEVEKELISIAAAAVANNDPQSDTSIQSMKFVDLQADVIKISHHGSGDSSGQKFLEEVMPKIAVIQVGADNEFGHPNRRVIKRLERINARILRTDLNGTVKLISDGKNITIK